MTSRTEQRHAEQEALEAECIAAALADAPEPSPQHLQLLARLWQGLSRNQTSRTA